MFFQGRGSSPCPDELIGGHLQLGPAFTQGKGVEEFIVGVEQHQLGFRADELIQERVGGGHDILLRMVRDAGPHLSHHRLTAGAERAIHW